MPLSKKVAAELIGTFWLVLGGCGSAVLAAKFPEVGIGFIGVAFAFGLTVLTMAFAVGHISGGHFNPAVTVGLFAGGRTPAGEVLPYIVAQVVGAILAAGVLYLIASGKAGFDLAGGFASNGYAEHSPGGYPLSSGFVCELVLTAGFLFVIMGATDSRAPAGFAPIAIGLALTLIHLISIPVTNTSVNPARSTGPAVFVGGWALAQLWLFWLAPILGHRRRARLSLADEHRTGGRRLGVGEFDREPVIAGFDPFRQFGQELAIIEALVHMGEDRPARPHPPDPGERLGQMAVRRMLLATQAIDDPQLHPGEHGERVIVEVDHIGRVSQGPDADTRHFAQMALPSSPPR